jgi:hypothetical protein
MTALPIPPGRHSSDGGRPKCRLPEDRTVNAVVLYLLLLRANGLAARMRIWMALLAVHQRLDAAEE